MLGNMMLKPLSVIDLLKHAAQVHASSEIVTLRVEGDIHRTNYNELYLRSGRLANALNRLGIVTGERVATLAWNTYRHMETYYAVSGIGAVVHTVNPRLFDEQIAYIINHAKDKWVITDTSFLPLLERIAPQLQSVKGFIIFCDEDAMPSTSLENALCYESLLKVESSEYDWPSFDENTAASLCYTSGTTGQPKGVLYSHRAAVLHAMAMVSESVLDIRGDSVILPMVTMYHASAWGIPYAAPLVGAKLVLSGAAMDGASMHKLINQESVTLGLGVPVIWSTLHQYLEANSSEIPSLQRVCVGGSASPYHLVRLFDEQYGVYWQPLWGMTETGPLATSAPLTKEMRALTPEQRYKIQTSAGKPVFGVELDIVNDNGCSVEHNGVARGELRIKGPWIMQHYYERPQNGSDGWLETGDIATMDEQGYLRIVDRKKDVIKSGGEWISSIELEDILSECPGVIDACVIGVKHEKWEERPLALLVMEKEYGPNKAVLVDYLTGKIAKWWMPDDFVFVDELPRTATGKITKHVLRQRYENHLQEEQS